LETTDALGNHYRGSLIPGGGLCYHPASSEDIDDFSHKVDILMKRFGLPERCVIVTAGAVAINLLVVGRADAQMQVWEDKGYFSVNYGYQFGNRSFEESLSHKIYDEDATYSIGHSSGEGGLLDIGGGIRVWRNLAAGVAITSFSTKARADITGKVPHPLFFGRPRNVTYPRVGLEYKELGIHLQMAWVVPLSGWFSMTFSGGPSFFSIDQSLITTVTPAGEIGAPYDEVGVASAAAKSVGAGGVGGNVGVDLTYLVTGQLGVGLFGRWTAAAVDIAASGGKQSIDAGGVQAGIGLRMRF